MLGGNGKRFAKAQGIGFQNTGFRHARLGLVGDNANRLAEFPDFLGELPVDGRNARPRINDKEHEIGFFNRHLGLGAHPRLKRFLLGVIKPRRVEYAETQVADLRQAFAAVARNPRLVIDKRNLAPNQTVE